MNIYTKQPISIDDQIAKLRSLGLIIADEDKAPHRGTLPRDTQSRGPSLLLTLVHIEQNVKSTSHVSYSFLILAAKLLFLLASIAMQNVAVCGIRTGYDLTI